MNTPNFYEMCERERLRDYFAAAALTGNVSALSSIEHFRAISKASTENNTTIAGQISRMAYEMADAMLKERSKQ